MHDYGGRDILIVVVKFSWLGYLIRPSSTGWFEQTGLYRQGEQARYAA